PPPNVIAVPWLTAPSSSAISSTGVTTTRSQSRGTGVSPESAQRLARHSYPAPQVGPAQAVPRGEQAAALPPKTSATPRQKSILRFYPEQGSTRTILIFVEE